MYTHFDSRPEQARTQYVGASVTIKTFDNTNMFLTYHKGHALDLSGKRVRLQILNSKPGWVSVRVYGTGRVYHVPEDTKLAINGISTSVKGWIVNEML